MSMSSRLLIATQSSPLHRGSAEYSCMHMMSVRTLVWVPNLHSEDEDGNTLERYVCLQPPVDRVVYTLFNI